MEKINNLSRQMGALSNKPDFDLEDLPQQRQIYIDRLGKCNKLIDKLISQLSSEEQEHMNQILSARLRKDDCSSEEAILFDCGVKCRALLRDTLAVDRETIKKVQQERDRFLELSTRSRRKSQAASLFHSDT